MGQIQIKDFTMKILKEIALHPSLELSAQGLRFTWGILKEIALHPAAFAFAACSRDSTPSITTLTVASTVKIQRSEPSAIRA